MADVLVSVVVPVYNVEAYLSECVESIRQQSYRNLEIILVDDGSPDGCPALCDKFAAEDPRVIVIHKKNGGLSDARNVGIERCKGDYITFVDSDDWIEPDFVRDILEAMLENKAEIGIGDYVRTNEDVIDGKSSLENTSLENPDGYRNGSVGVDAEGKDEGGREHIDPGSLIIVKYSGREAIRACYQSEKHGMSFTAWGKIYAADLFRVKAVADDGQAEGYGFRNESCDTEDNRKKRLENESTGSLTGERETDPALPIRFPVGKINEDSFITYRLLYKASRVVYVDRILYDYRTTEGSIMQKPFSLRRLDGLEAAEGAWRFFLGTGEEELAALAGNYYCRLYFQICYRLKRSRLYDGQEMKQFRHKMRKEIADCLAVCHVPAGKKFVYRCTARFPADFILKKVMAE